MLGFMRHEQSHEGGNAVIEATGTRSGRRFRVLLAVVATVAASLVAVVGASPAGAAPGPPNKLAFTPNPGGGTAGIAWVSGVQPVVTIQDFGGATTTSTAFVYLRITGNPPGATLQCTANPVQAVAGVATFAGCHIDKAGNYSLTAEDPTDGLSKESNDFTILAGTATKLGFVQQPGYGTLAQPLTTQPKVAAQDQFGNTTTTGAPATITIAIANNAGPAGVLTCTSTLTVPPASGVATFSGCQISVAGTGYTLGATSATPSLTAATSASFNVSSATATGLAFVTQPSSGAPAPGLLPTFKVAFVDSAARVVATNVNSIAISRTPAVGSLGGPCTSPVVAAAGVATFTGCTLSQPGVFQLVADQGSGPDLPTATSDSFTVGILHLAFVNQPSNGTAGNPLPSQPVVAVQDASDTTVSSNSAITLSIAPGTGTPGATLTCDQNPLAPAPPSVLAVFALCKVDLPGVGYRITATSTVLGLSADSAPFNVAGPATHLVFLTQPSNGNAGIPLATQPVVAIEDAAGQVVTTDNTTLVTLTKTVSTPLSGGPGALGCAPKVAVAGVATFTGCFMNQAGIGYRVTASSNPVLTTANSELFDITGLQRIFGADAIDTSIAVSQKAFPGTGSANAVVLARSDFFSDALAGGPLAANKGGPLLITPGADQSSILDPRVLAEIQRLIPSGHTVYILGGTLALAPGIDTTLNTLGYVPVRVAGENLFGTAVAIAGRLGNPSTVFEATGTNFPDALSAVPAAIRNSGAILLTNGNQQAPETAAYLAAHPPTVRYAIGGPLAAAGADPSAIPVYGADLFDTAVAVADRFFPSPGVFGVATGLNYPDALSGGVFMATGGRLGPMILVNTNLPLPPSVSNYFTLMPPTPGYVFGGPIAVSEDVVTTIVSLL